VVRRETWRSARRALARLARSSISLSASDIFWRVWPEGGLGEDRAGAGGLLDGSML
jgi:hypothetical protein